MAETGSIIEEESDESGCSIWRRNRREDRKVDAMAEKIAYLDRHREKLGQMGQKACESARKKCSVEAYADYLLGLTAES